MKIRRLLPIGALALLATGCGLLRVNVNTSSSGVGSGKGAGAGSGQSAGSASGDSKFTGANDKTVKVKLDKNRNKNPVLTKMTVHATINPKKAGFECGFGDYVSTAPNALVTIGPGAENLTIKARSNVAGILLSKDGKFFCANDDKLRSISDRVSLKPNGLAAGTYELRVLLASTMAKKMVKGEGYKPHDVDVVVAFYDHTRGETYDKSVKQISLNEAPKRPLFVTGKTHGGEGFRKGGSRCKASYGDMPHAVFESDRPMGRIKFRALWAAKPFEVRMQELPEKGKLAANEGWCSDDWPAVTSVKNMEGRVAIHVGNRGGTESRPFGYVVMSPDTVVDPYGLSPVPRPKKLEIVDRQLSNHFPFFGEYVSASRNSRVGVKFTDKPVRGGSEVDKLRQRMFLEAPKELFVTPKYDLDKNATRTKASNDYPKKGEALLIFEAKRKNKYVTVFRADGSQWSVLTSALVHPDGLSVPSKTSRTFAAKNARRESGPEDQDLHDKLRSEREKYDKCFKRQTAAADKQIDAINNTRLHWTTYNKRRKNRIWDAAASAAKRSCGKKKLEQLEVTTNEQLAERRKQRIDDRLAKIAERLAKL